MHTALQALRSALGSLPRSPGELRRWLWRRVVAYFRMRSMTIRLILAMTGCVQPEMDQTAATQGLAGCDAEHVQVAAGSRE